MSSFKKYIKVMQINFKNGVMYKLDYFSGIINILFVIVINILVWKTLYESPGQGNTTQYKMMVTYIILSTIIQTTFIMDEFCIERTIKDGTIIHYLLKPMNFKAYLFSNAVGRLLFNLLMLLIPAVICIKLFFDILMPYSPSYFVYFLITTVLGYIVLYTFNFIFWTFAFESMTSWGLITLKNAFISVLSGALIPLYLMPDSFVKVIENLPFQSIYYFPLAIYLGILPQAEIIKGIILQLVWIGVFVLIGELLWRRVIKEIVVQGG